jgi:hypothetical protein
MLARLITYMVVVGKKFYVGTNERGKCLDFRLSEVLMALSKPNQVLHLERVG